MKLHAPPPRGGSPWAVAFLFIGYGIVHSLLASSPVKRAVARAAGERARNGLYRPAYIVQAVLITVWAVRRFLRLPDRDLYRVPPPWSGAFGGVQLASLALLASAIGSTGLGRILGLPQLAAYLRGELPAPEAAAQGPALAASGDRIDARGPFRYIRHPDNLPMITLFLSFPRMTVNRLTLGVLTLLYAVLGSVHEDSRLRRAYGKAFTEYARRTPMLFPRR